MQNLIDPIWKDETYYRDQWVQFYEIRRKALVQLAIGIVPFLITVALAGGMNLLFSYHAPYFLGITIEIFAIAAWLYYAFMFFKTTWQYGSWDCPRCGEQFFYGTSERNPFARHCLHCGLRRPRKSEVSGQ